jgi:hypothetical protein
LIWEVPEKQTARMPCNLRASTGKLKQKVNRASYVDSELSRRMGRSLSVVGGCLQDLFTRLGGENNTHG